MARKAADEFTLPDGRKVGYGLTNRKGVYRVRFAGPDGNRVETTTGCTAKSDAYLVAAKLVLKVYAPTLPPDPRTSTWETVLAEIDKTPSIRPETRRDYRKAVALLRNTIPESKGPGDITPELAVKFRRVYAQTPFKKSRKSDGKEYPRSNNTVRAALRKLSSLFRKHLRELGFVNSNPFANVTPPPQTKKLPDVPSDETVNEFFDYLRTRYPDWPLLRLFCDVKCLTACRTLDLCSLRADQVREGRIVFDADQVKGRAARSVLLPADLFAELEAYRGKSWLWERYLTEVSKYRRRRGNVPTKFDPDQMATTIYRVFLEFNASRPGKPELLPHGLRRRAITKLTLATQSVDATAQAVGVDPATARKYYLDAQKAFDNDALFTRMADQLRPGK